MDATNRAAEDTAVLPGSSRPNLEENRKAYVARLLALRELREASREIELKLREAGIDPWRELGDYLAGHEAEMRDRERRR